jgi:hypothetical protein
MPGWTNGYESTILNFLYGAVGSPMTAPADYRIALFSVAPTDSTGGTELSGNGYARVTVTNNTTNWGAAGSAGAARTNAVAITFPTATGAWSAATSWGAFLPDGTTLTIYGDLTTPKTLANGDTASFAIGALSISAD